jgi:predicted hydrolase (HD superfamily)
MSYDHQKFFEAVKAQLEPKIFAHSLAVEACMGAIYDYLKSNGLLDPTEPPREDWVLAGLVHDVDFSGEFKEFHPNRTNDVLSKYGLELPESIVMIVKAHSPKESGVQPRIKAQWALFCVDSLTGLIAATAMVYPSKKLVDVKLSSISKRFHKEPRFAAGTRRDEVAQCEKADGLSIPLEKFFEISLNAMLAIASSIGL